MADDKAPDETTEGSDAATAGPVAGEDSSSSQAAGEEPTPTPPADEAPEAPADSVEDESPAEEQSSEEEPSEEVVEETPAEEPSEEEAEVVEAVAIEETEEGEVLAEVEIEIEVEEEPEPAERKKDVIPGADLEPIKVDADPELSAEEKARLEAEEEEKARREAALVGSDDPDAVAAARAPAKMESDARFLATGKRKCSIARVTLLPGDGKIEINKRDIEEFFPRPLHRTLATQPLTVSGYEGNVDVRVRVHGGGISGQAGAVRHGIARALIEIDPELRGDLKRRGFLTRDARVKERRKAGFKKARKKPQFSKR
jgi:small subunit ribosomal protein S9